MRGTSVRIAAATGAGLAVIAGTAGAAGHRDFALGHAVGVPGAFGTDSILVAARQHGSGAHGHLALVRRGTPQGTVRVHAAVYCLVVSGNLARVSGKVKQSNSAAFPKGSDLTFELQDNGKPQGGTPDAFSFGTNGACTAVAASFGVVTRGNLRVHDAP